jgi:hypothetical protein
MWKVAANVAHHPAADNRCSITDRLSVVVCIGVVMLRSRLYLTTEQTQQLYFRINGSIKIRAIAVV